MKANQPVVAGQMTRSYPRSGTGTSPLQRAADRSPQIQSLNALQRMANLHHNASSIQRVEDEEALQGKAIQRAEDEELLQGKAIQRMEEEDALQGKAVQRMEEDELQMKPIQRMDDEEPLQGKAIQRVEDEEALQGKAIQRAEVPKPNNTGLPDTLKSGIESLSGMSMDHVQVHRNSDKPAAVGAHAYAQGSQIHLGPGQEQHLPHEAWHVVQQAQGRVKPTMQLKGIAVNDDAGLEKEADVMGAKAISFAGAKPADKQPDRPDSQLSITQRHRSNMAVVQRTEVPVAGGVFKDIEYRPEDGEFGKGAFINLQFTADDGLGEDGDTISLVQTVKDYVNRTDTTGGDATLHPTTSQLGNRKLAADERGVGADDVGTGIDQEVLDDDDNVVNTDPRYTEQRMSSDQALNTTGRSDHPHSVRSATKNAGVWSKARLNDAPEVSLKLPGFHWRNNATALATLTGGMDFEVAALNNSGNEFVGSVKWGWRMSGENAVLNPTNLTLADHGSATPLFFKAAAKWNNTRLIDRDGSEIDPMQLPLDADKLGIYGQQRSFFEAARTWVSENPGKSFLGISGLMMLGLLGTMAVYNMKK